MDDRCEAGETVYEVTPDIICNLCEDAILSGRKPTDYEIQNALKGYERVELSVREYERLKAMEFHLGSLSALVEGGR